MQEKEVNEIFKNAINVPIFEKASNSCTAENLITYFLQFHHCAVLHVLTLNTSLLLY